MSFSIKYLNGEECYRVYWTEMGSARSWDKLVKWHVSHNKLNPNTLKPPTRMGVWKAAYRWAVRNPELAYQIANNAMADVGKFLTKERWMTEMREKVNSSWQNEAATKKFEAANAS